MNKDDSDDEADWYDDGEDGGDGDDDDVSVDERGGDDDGPWSLLRWLWG